MSLKGEMGMLGIDHQHGRHGSDEPGTDPGFLEGSGEVRFSGQRREEVYAWTEQTLVRHRYPALSRWEKGLVRSYVACMTGLSRAQVTRLITGYTASGGVKAATYQRRKFASRYSKADIELLAYADKAHGNLWSGDKTNTGTP